MKETVKRIQNLIEGAGITVRELAEIAGCSKSAMQRYISGERDIPTNVINGIASAFNVHPAYLFGWVDDKNYNPDEQKQFTEGELSPLTIEIMQKVEEMTEDQKKKFLQVLSLFDKEQ